MVGVPRSKGCSVCRERRIKCDEARPECTQCRRYGRPCPGYNRSLKFQDEGPALKRRHQQSSAQRSPQGNASQNDALSASGAVPANALVLARKRGAATSIDESVSPSLVRKTFGARQPQLFMDFIKTAFPTLYFHNRFRSGSDLAFPEYIMANFGTRPYQDSAVSCLSTVYLAHLTKDPSLARTSRHLYAKALREVIRALDTDDAVSDDMVSTIMMLSVFEMYAQTSKDAWTQHANAVKQLMLRRGVKAHESGFGRSCYIAFRGFLIATAIFEGKPCFLDEEEWQDFAMRVQEEDSRKPGEWSVFVEISELVFMELSKCPRYLSEALAITSSSVFEDVVSLVERIRGTREKLQVLTDQLELSIAAHSQREQGISFRPGSFIGPVPEVFPDTSPSLLLRGARGAVTALDQLLERLRNYAPPSIRLEPPRLEEALSPTPSADSTSETLSQESSPRTISSIGSPRPTFSLPFRVVSDLGRGPSRTTDKSDPQAVTWLDRIASSMGMIGAEIVYDDNEDGLDCGVTDMTGAIIEEIEEVEGVEEIDI
jgi:hypothetical protein